MLAVTMAVPSASTYSQQPASLGAIGDLLPICDAYGEADVIFVGRIEPPITYRLSADAEAEVEKARQKLIDVRRDTARLKASLDPRTQWERDLEAESRLVEAESEFDMRQTMLSLVDYDLTLFPVVVEQALRGVTEPTLMLRVQDPSMNVEPGELYVIAGFRSQGMIPPVPEIATRLPFAEYVDTLRVTQVNAATHDLRLLAATAGGATILGDVRRHSHDIVGAPLSAIRILVSSATQTLETVTHEDGSFIVSGIEPGPVVLTPLFPRPLAVVNKTALTVTFGESWCKQVGITAELNGQIRGRILVATDDVLATAELVLQGVQGDDLRRITSHSFRTTTRPDEYGGFEFSGVPPGSYLLTAVLQRTENGKTRYSATYFPGTRDLATAVPIVVGSATEHEGVDFPAVAD